jgi:hypothetical protein
MERDRHRVVNRRLWRPVVTEVLAARDAYFAPGQDKIHATIARAFDQYRSSVGTGEVTGLNWRKSLEDGAAKGDALSVEALGYLNGMRALFAKVDKLGLNSLETQNSREVLALQIKPEQGISLEEFLAAIQGAKTK